MDSVATCVEQWFSGSEPLMRQLREGVQRLCLPAGQAVFHRGDACANYLVVLSGSVRVQLYSPGGREVVLYRVGDGQSCVITTSCLISREAYPAEGVTERETQALAMPRALFDKALSHSEHFRRFVFANQGQRLGDLIQRVEEVAFGRVDVRLAKHLMDRSADQGEAVSATHQQLASELGTAREVVSRQLKAFEKKGWIVLHRGSIEIVQPQALSRLWAPGGEPAV
jgi:CRP/FNR family transcriptional regulator